MGIYPGQPWYAYDTTHDGPIMHKVWDTGYGEVVVETWVKICELRDRRNCFCCSCRDQEGSDPACRNHGWAARRPCERHNMPGQAWGEEICFCAAEHKPNCLEGKMPDSVERAAR